MGRQGGLYSIVKVPRSLLSLQKECSIVTFWTPDFVADLHQ